MSPGSGPAARRGDAPRYGARAGGDTFAELADRFRSRIHLLCYRLVGSFEDAIRLTNDTFLTGWRLRRSAPADREYWLMAIAVRACLDEVRRRRPPSPRPLRPESCVPRSDVTWLQPYPDLLLPDDIASDTIGLPYVRASQSLSPRDRATLVLADIQGWSRARIAGALRMPDTDVVPRLERARAVIQAGSAPASATATATATADDGSDEELRAALADCFAAADTRGIAEFLHADVRATMPPLPFSFEGHGSVLAVLGDVFRTADPARRGRRRCAATRANRQPAIAVYVQPRPSAAFHGHELVVARAESGRIVELTLFEAGILPAFGLPTEFRPGD